MPRNAKDSDDELEAKSGRRTRAALNPSVLDSPLRRSSRIKQPTQQDGSSPDSVSDVSTTGTTRTTRRKTTTGDAAVNEPVRNTRTRRTSIASDISELTETESLPDGPPKRITRRSVASIAAVDTPPSINGRTRRATRAGSESKSTPPVGRTTRRNRASSLEPEAMEEQVIREVGTPVKSRRRASALPSEPAVAEESEDSGRTNRRSVTKTVYEVDEDSPESQSLNTSKSSRRKSKNDANKSAEKIEVDESSVGESEANTIERSTRKNSEAPVEVSNVSHKLEDSIVILDSSDTKKPDDGSPQQLSSPSRSSSYTIESLLSPSTDKQEKSPGNKENEILNENAALLEKTDRVSNRSDIRFSSRNSLGSTHVKSQEKRLNVSVDDRFLSNDYEIPTKSQEDTELTNKSTPKMIRKERYSVDDCVVIIEPMEMNHIDKITNNKTLNTPELPKRRKSHQIEDITIEEMEDKEIECILPGKDARNTENVIINENVADRETNFEISNVVSIAFGEKDEKVYEPEPMDVDESPDAFDLELKDTGEANEEKAENDGANDEDIIVETSTINTNSRISISKEKIASDVNDIETSTEISVLNSKEKSHSDCGNDEKTSPKPSVSNNELGDSKPEETAPKDSANDENTAPEASVSNDELRVLNPEEKTPTDNVNDENKSPEPSVSNEEIEILNSKEKAPKDGVNDEKASSEHSVSNDEIEILNSKEKASKDSVNDGKASSEHSVSNDEPQVSNSEEKTIGDNGNDETTSSEQLITNTEQLSSNSEKETVNDRANDKTTSSEPLIQNIESLASNSEEKVLSDVVNDEKTSVECSNPGIELTASDSSTNNEKSINSAEIEENLVCAKGRKSSIVTELPTTGVNSVEGTNVSEEKRRKSTSSANEDQKKNEKIEDKSSEKEVETAKKIAAHQSDDESEYDGYPAFKDIPADEWNREDNEKTNKNTDNDTNSVHSVSTERNGSEFDFELVDKEFPQGSEKEDQAKSDYDSDDTVKIAVARRKSGGQNNDEEASNALPASEETPMDVSSDEEDTDIKANNSVSMKNDGLNTSRKIKDAKTPNKNTSLIADTSGKATPIGLNSSRRKSLLSVDDDQSNDNSNNSMRMNSSVNNSSKKKSLNANARSEEENNSDNNGEADSTEVLKTPKMITRKSLDASAKKSKNTPDSSRTIGSAKNTPSNAEKKDNETSAKRNRSLSKSATSLPSDDAENSFDDTAGSEPTMEENQSVNISKHTMQAALRKQLNAGSPAKRLSDAFSSANNSPASPKVNKKRISINKSKNIDASDMEAESQEDVEEESQENVSTPKVQLNESRKSVSAKKSTIDKNNWVMSTNAVTVIKSNMESPASPEPRDTGLDQGLDTSAKSRSAKKSANKNTRKSGANSESEIDNENAPEKLNKSAKIGSAKKSANISKSSVISSDSVEEDEDSQENLNMSQISASRKKSAIDKNYSTIAQVNSDSDVDEDVESESTDDDADISRKIPGYLFDCSSESNSRDSAKSIDSDVERDMNLHGKSVLEYSDDDVPADDCMATESESSDDDDDGADLIDFVVDDDEVEEEEEDFSDVEHDLGLNDDRSNESLSSEEKKPRKRIIPRPPRDSDSEDSEEEEEGKAPTNVSSRLDKSNTAKTPIKPAKLNKSQENVETEAKPVDLNVSAKNIGTKNKNLLIQCSTPKSVTKQSLLSEQSNSAKATSEQNESEKMADSPVKLSGSASKKLSKSVCETVQTPAKLCSSFKLTKTPKSSLSVQQQLQTSLPVDLNETANRTNLSKVKSTKVSTLNQTVVPPESESPETRFLMKQKLNDSMPALKLQQKAKALRRSVLDNLREEIQATKEVPEENDEMPEEVAEERMSLSVKEATSETEVSSEKKKKKKKHASENTGEISTSLIENVEEISNDLNTSTKKSKKQKKTKIAETMEQEETKSAEIPKKRKKKAEDIGENVVSDDAGVKGKKKKKKHEEIIENIVLDEPGKKVSKKKKKHEAIIENVVLDEDDKKERKTKIKHQEKIDKVILDEIDKKKKKKKPVEMSEKLDSDEVENKKKKKKKKDRIAARNDQNSGSDEPEAMDFAVARDAALRDFRKITESIKAGQEAKKKKQHERTSKTQPEVAESFEKMKTSVKRLPDDILANLSDIAERPKKRRKVNKEEVAPSKSKLNPLPTKSGNFQVDDGYIPLSSTGGTTQFAVANLKKVVKHSKKAVAASTFRERMLARNPRQPVSAYLMYQQKQKHSTGADRLY